MTTLTAEEKMVLRALIDNSKVIGDMRYVFVDSDKNNLGFGRHTLINNLVSLQDKWIIDLDFRVPLCTYVFINEKKVMKWIRPNQ